MVEEQKKKKTKNKKNIYIYTCVCIFSPQSGSTAPALRIHMHANTEANVHVKICITACRYAGNLQYRQICTPGGQIGHKGCLGTFRDLPGEGPKHHLCPLGGILAQLGRILKASWLQAPFLKDLPHIFWSELWFFTRFLCRPHAKIIAASGWRPDSGPAVGGTRPNYCTADSGTYTLCWKSDKACRTLHAGRAP